MVPRLTVALLLLAVVVSVRPADVAADQLDVAVTESHAHGTDAIAPVEQPVLPSAAAACEEFVTEGRELVQEIADLNADGPRGRPRVCITYYTSDDIYQAVILRYDSARQFRDAKIDAVRRLNAIGFDVCAIGTWQGYGRTAESDRLHQSDYLDVPVECPPRVIAADAGAIPMLPVIVDAVGRGMAATAEQMGWRPNRALTIIALTEIDTAVATYRKFMRPQDAEELARAGRSTSIRRSLYGGLILFNLAKASSPAAIDIFIAHEYTHFAQGSIGGSNDYFPKWFIEGQAVYQEVRNSPSTNGDYLYRLGVRLERGGAPARLRDLSRYEDWQAQEEKGAAASDAAYARGYAAVSYLVTQLGFETTVQLFRANRNGSLEHFDDALLALTGFDTEALDGAVGGWLLSGAIPAVAARPAAPTTAVPVAAAPRAAPTPVLTQIQPAPVSPAASPASPYTGGDAPGSLRIAITVAGDGASARAIVEILRDISCSPNLVLAENRTYTLALALLPNGGFSGQIVISSAAVLTLDGLINSAEARGTVRYQSAGSGCDTGPLAFVARAG